MTMELEPPPVFDLPPPPPPPWLPAPPLCGECGEVPGVTSVNTAPALFRSVLVVLVLATSLVIALVTVVLLLRRRYRGRAKLRTSAEQLTTGLAVEKCEPVESGMAAGPAQNYYTREHQLVVDQSGQTIIIPAGTLLSRPRPVFVPAPAAVEMNTSEHKYETIDSDTYCEHPIYENPDLSVYQDLAPLSRHDLNNAPLPHLGRGAVSRPGPALRPCYPPEFLTRPLRRDVSKTQKQNTQSFE